MPKGSAPWAVWFWNDLRWKLRKEPSARCHKGADHKWFDLYGDAIIAMGYKRSFCWYCGMGSPRLMEVNDDPSPRPAA